MVRAKNRGFTLVELVVILALLAVGASAVAPTARRLADRSAVVAAREEIVRALARGRAEAVASGGSVVTVHAQPPRIRVLTSGWTMREVPLQYPGLRVRLTGGRDSITFRYDRLGVGRFASGSVRLDRGEARAGLVVSSYGRIRRR
ncbi:MAG: prepilin-type N-terminal cleavage/methylation domain-containing protein [Longimicrobiales bacterium]|nr:prepilin-type N-terminal cleavage/methylation domain-containing protein [Longimicrobiales bacterium]